jgi:prepilin-type N-terminal cleavage/methylation domain-containing protein
MIHTLKTKFISGFSLGEVLITLAIISIVSSIAVTAFKGMNERQVLDKSILSVMSIINETRSSSLSSKDSSDHGVYIEEGKITSFIGSNYSPTDSKNVIYDLNSLVRVSSSVPKTIVFKRTTGILFQNSPIVVNVSLKKDVNASSSIIVFPTGIIQKNAL